ncbi:MAG: adenylate/guanylate cyclase domain-containing protein [Leptospirales bacterium]
MLFILYSAGGGLGVGLFSRFSYILNTGFMVANFMVSLRFLNRGEFLEYRLVLIACATMVGAAGSAGVIGERKFAYDVRGDTVNIVSRYESSGVAGRINISGAVHEKVREIFECEHRGRVPAKHKGEIDMYFVDGLRPEFSMNGAGEVPNEKFQAACTDLARDEKPRET